MTILSAVGLGLAMGTVFGFALEKSRVFEPALVLGQMQLHNFLLIKVWFSAVATALIGVTLLHEFGIVSLHPQPVLFAADIIGGLLVGVGITLAGGSPAIIVAQIGAGYRDSWFAILGGMAGVATFCTLAPSLQPLLGGATKASTLVDVTGMPFPALGVAIAVLLFACLMASERVWPWRRELGLEADGLFRDRDIKPEEKVLSARPESRTEP